MFFIDKVANYTETNGLIRRLFIEEYSKLYQEFYNTTPTNIDEVHGGYFAKTNKGDFTDHSRSMEGESSKAVYDRILKEKMKLLSFDDPMEFIFFTFCFGGWMG